MKYFLVLFSVFFLSLTNSSFGKSLIDTIKSKDWELVKVSVEGGTDVNITDNTGSTALMYASGIGHFETVELLVKKGADVNAEAKLGRTALTIAIQWGHSKIAKLLIDNGAKINLADKLGWTPLMYASSYGRTDMVKLLVQKGVQVDTVIKKTGKSALDLASKEEIKALLIQAGSK